MDTQTHSVATEEKPTAPSTSPTTNAHCAANRAAGVMEDQGQSALRLKRIAEYLGAALESPQPEVGLLGGITADLAKMELRLNQAIEEVLAECDRPREYLDTVPQGVEVMLKVSRQIERCMRLSHELSRPRDIPDDRPCVG